MDHKITALILALVFVAPMSANGTSDQPIDRKASWGSFDAALRSFLEIPATSWRATKLDYRAERATSKGLRVLDRVLQNLRKTKLIGDIELLQMERSIVDEKSIREIAIIGLLMGLSETANAPSGHELDWARRCYRTEEMVSDVVTERKNLLDALAILQTK